MNDLHPIANLALTLLVRNSGCEACELDAQAQERLTASLDEHSDRAELESAVRALVDLAFYFAEDRGWTAAANTLIAIATTAIERLDLTSTVRQLDRVRARARAFEQLSDRKVAFENPAIMSETTRQLMSSVQFARRA